MSAIVKVIGTADGRIIDGMIGFVVAWNPHTAFGTADVTVSEDLREARVFDGLAEIIEEWRAVSDAMPVRPTDGQPNRPLMALTIEIVQVG